MCITPSDRLESLHDPELLQLVLLRICEGVPFKGRKEILASTFDAVKLRIGQSRITAIAPHGVKAVVSIGDLLQRISFDEFVELVRSVSRRGSHEEWSSGFWFGGPDVEGLLVCSSDGRNALVFEFHVSPVPNALRRSIWAFCSRLDRIWRNMGTRLLRLYLCSVRARLASRYLKR